MVYFIATIKEKLAERLVRLFRDNIWKLYKLLESIISAIVEFVINNKVHSAIKVFLFITNYRRELRIEVNIRRILYTKSNCSKDYSLW